MKEKNGRLRKMIAPIVIAAILAVYTCGYFAICLLFSPPAWIKILGGAAVVGLIGVLIFVTIERLKEIRSGETDDLSNY